MQNVVYVIIHIPRYKQPDIKFLLWSENHMVLHLSFEHVNDMLSTFVEFVNHKYAYIID